MLELNHTTDDMAYDAAAVARDERLPMPRSLCNALPQAAKQASDTPRSVLVVEDDPFVALDIEDTLREAGFDVLGPCATVAEALEILTEHKPCAATLDYNLSRRTSRSVARKLDDLDIPFLMCTSESRDQLADPVFAECTIVRKPFRTQRLVASTRELMDI